MILCIIPTLFLYSKNVDVVHATWLAGFCFLSFILMAFTVIWEKGESFDPSVFVGISMCIIFFGVIGLVYKICQSIANLDYTYLRIVGRYLHGIGIAFLGGLSLTGVLILLTDFDKQREISAPLPPRL